MEEPGGIERGGGERGVLPALGRLALAALLVTSGIGHLVAPEEFLAQVPPWFPAPGAVVLVSGVVELALAAALVFWSRRRVQVGWVLAGFFVVVFPGNVSQAVTGADAFGLDSPTARWLRLAFQPVLVASALWSTGAWHAWRRR
jgi:uncharacterized membrane protein